MKKLICALLAVATLSTTTVTTASASDTDILKVGLRYGSSAMFAANLQNEEGSGYRFGWYDEYRDFYPIGETRETTITMIAGGDIYMNGSGEYTSEPTGAYRVLGGYHAELTGYDDFYDAASDAEKWRDAWPAYIEGEYVVRIGSYTDQWEAESRAQEVDGRVVESSDTGILVTETRTEHILFEYDDPSGYPLGVEPQERHGEPVTWFKGYKYRGGFEYARKRGGNLSVINVVELEDYVKGVIPYEMSPSWPLEALKAQAVGARTFAKACVKHRSDGFDVCNGQHCQVYGGLNVADARSDRAVDETAGELLYYDGKLVPDAVYHASNGGATEDGEVIWGGKSPYLKGKLDPYEAQTNIPGYQWSVTYSASELTWILEQKGYTIGQVRNVYISKRTSTGNVQEVVFEGSRDTLRITGERCRIIFGSSTYNKYVKSQRYEINGGGAPAPGVYINDTATPVEDLTGVTVLDSSGKLVTLAGNAASVITASGVKELSGGQVSQPAPSRNSDSFTITGAGNGHNVGMSQYGAKAMAELGHNYRDILEFYYTDITIE